MKLFDRSVDFAQFSEDTPLYALARAWMQNKPYGTKLSDSQDGNLDGDSPSNSQESALSSSSHSVSRKCCFPVLTIIHVLWKMWPQGNDFTFLLVNFDTVF